MDLQILDGQWALSDGTNNILATVPGDITYDCYNAGLVKYPYYGDNYKMSQWVRSERWTYSVKFKANKNRTNKKINLVFDGIDTYSVIKLNGKEVG